MNSSNNMAVTYTVSLRSEVIRAQSIRSNCSTLLAILILMSSPCTVVLAARNSSEIDALITKARQQLEMDQRLAYSRVGAHPKKYTKKQIADLDRVADDRLLAAVSRFPNVSGTDIEKLKATLSAARIRPDWMSPPTEYENVLQYNLIQIVLKQIYDGVREFEKSHPNIPNITPPFERIVVGTVPSGNINAGTQIINEGEKERSRHVYLIEIDAGLLKFAELFSGILARIAAPSDPTARFLSLNLNRSEVEKHLQANPAIPRDFGELMRTYLVRGGPFLATQLEAKELDEPYATMASLIYRSMLVYAISHELGHVLYDRYEVEKTANTQLPEGWSEEYFADGMALTLSLMATGHNTTVEVSVLGARQYFVCYDLIERGISAVAKGEEFYTHLTDHPPAARRKEKINRYVEVALRRFWNLEPASINDLNAWEDSTQFLESDAELLWARTKPTLVKLHQDKVPLAECWQRLIPP